VKIKDDACSTELRHERSEDQKVGKVMNLNTIVSALQVKHTEPEKGQDKERHVFNHLERRSTTSVPLYWQAENIDAIHPFERFFLVTS
jgi:hypothetical protein